MTKEKTQIFKLLEIACKQTPDKGLLEIIGSCFSGGDISHIDDAELLENLKVLIEVNRESKTLQKKKRRSHKGRTGSNNATKN